MCNGVKNIENLNEYNFILFIRIDLFLKPHFFDIFDPTINKILFPTICWKHHSTTYWGHPRVNPVMILIPNKYYEHLRHIHLFSHEGWDHLIRDAYLSYDDLDTMINTFHDSDSEKDFNPLYYMVNRHQCEIDHSIGHVFNKYDYNY